MHAVKWFQVFLSNSSGVICTKLNSFIWVKSIFEEVWNWDQSTFSYFYLQELYCELNYQKIRRTLTLDIRKHRTTVSTSLRLSCVYCDLRHRRSRPRPHIAELKLYNWVSHQSISYSSDAKLTSYGYCAAI